MSFFHWLRRSNRCAVRAACIGFEARWSAAARAHRGGRRSARWFVLELVVFAGLELKLLSIPCAELDPSGWHARRVDEKWTLRDAARFVIGKKFELDIVVRASALFLRASQFVSLRARRGAHICRALRCGRVVPPPLRAQNYAKSGCTLSASLVLLDWDELKRTADALAASAADPAPDHDLSKMFKSREQLDMVSKATWGYLLDESCAPEIRAMAAGQKRVLERLVEAVQAQQRLTGSQ